MLKQKNCENCNSLPRRRRRIRRCDSCKKLLFFRPYRCEHCQCRFHKRCLVINDDDATGSDAVFMPPKTGRFRRILNSLRGRRKLHDANHNASCLPKTRDDQYLQDNIQYDLPEGPRLQSLSRAAEFTKAATYNCPKPRETLKSDLYANHTLAATWPPGNDTLADDDNDSVFSDEHSDSAYLRQELGECKIAASDIAIIQELRVNHVKSIFRARWHGDVIAHQYKDKQRFCEVLNQLSRIRHENVVLFMGACVEPPRYLIVTAHGNAISLFERVHHKRGDHLSLHSKISIARQIAQGMHYLHSKQRIIMKHLNSKNVFVDSKIRISMLDNAIISSSDYRQENYAAIPKGHLTYIAPEILREVVVTPPLIIPPHATFQSDVFAFGTILFEIFSGCYPMQRVPPECVIWRVSVGDRQAMGNMKCTSSVKNLIEECWLHDQYGRPEFKEISIDLEKNAGMWKRHSSSEPDKLDREHSGRHFILF